MISYSDLEECVQFFDTYLFNKNLNFIPKTIINLRGDIICSERIVIMPAEVLGIGNCVKTLYVDDKKNIRRGTLECFFYNGIYRTFDANLITKFRTVVITILILKKLNLLNTQKICIIGSNGRIGSELIKMLSYYTNNIVSIGKSDTLIPDCDILISCSSNLHKNKIRKLPNVNMSILLDSGYQFKVNTSNIEIYGDNIKSLNKNIKVEFPFYEMKNFERSIFSSEFTDSKNRKIACVVGDGIYDLLLSYLITFKNIQIN